MKRSGKRYRLLITAGPTREPIDPVRFISNQSTGVLGYALAQAARARGHRVTLVSGPTEIAAPRGVREVQVETASEMEQVVMRVFARADALIMGAAVADFRPLRKATRKIKRLGAAGSLRLWQLELVENPDIVAQAARRRKKTQVVIGFALETERLLSNARQKLRTKHLDAIIATRLSAGKRGGNPFGRRLVEGAILRTGGKPQRFRALSKDRLAARILDTAEKLLQERLSVR